MKHGRVKIEPSFLTWSLIYAYQTTRLRFGHKYITEIGRTISGITKNPNQHPLYFKQFQWQFNKAMYNVSTVQGIYDESAFEELDEIFYIVKPNNIF